MYAGGTLPMGLGAKAGDPSQFGKLWLAGREGAMVDGINAPSSPYKQVLWAYKCIRALHLTCSGIPLQLTRSDGADLKYHSKSYRPIIRRSTKRTLRAIRGFKGVCVGRAAEGELIESGEAFELLEKPNSYMDWPKLIQATIGYLFARGKVAWILTGLRGIRPSEIHPIDGKYINPIWATDSESGMPVLMGYKYRTPRTGRELTFSTDMVKYWALWDDGDDPLGGMSPGMPGRLAMATDYNASLYNAHSLVNGCEPGLKISFPQTLTPEQRDEFRMSINSRYQGPAKAHRPLILEGGATAESLATVLKDMAWDKLKNVTRLELCALYDVPPVVAGWVEAAGDSSAYTENALRQFYQQAIFPTLDGLIPAIQEIVSRFDIRQVVHFNVEDQPVVQQMRESRIDSAEKLFKMGRPWEDINETLDLGMRARPWDHVGLVPVGMVPVTDAIEGVTFEEPLDEGDPDDNEPPTEPPSTDDDEHGETDEPDPGKSVNLLPASPSSAVTGPASDPISKDAMKRLWKAWERSFSPLAKRCAGVLHRNFSVQERRVIKLLKKYLAEADRRSAATEPGQIGHPGQKTQRGTGTEIVGRILVEVFHDPEQVKKFRMRLLTVASDGYELGIRQSLTEAGLTGEALATQQTMLMADPRITAAMRSDAVRISTKLNAFTRKHLRQALVDGLDGGESVKQLADRVQGFMANRRKSALTIARNAVGQSLSQARHEGRRTTGITHEIWIHSRGPGDRREEHVAAEAVYRKDPKPIAGLFNIGGAFLRYPRDPNGPPGEVVNCQCIAIGKRLSPDGKKPKGTDVNDEITKMLIRSFVTYGEMIAAREQAA